MSAMNDQSSGSGPAAAGGAQPLTEHIRSLIEAAIPGARAEVHAGGGGHFRIAVTASAFAGKGLLEKQRLVYSAIAELMKGDNAPIHAVDQLLTAVPAGNAGGS